MVGVMQRTPARTRRRPAPKPLRAPDVRSVLSEALGTAFDARSWHGPTLLGSIRSVTPELARRRIGRRKTIWEQVLHATYWKHVVVNKLAGTTRFPRRGTDWPHVPDDAGEPAWRDDVALLKATQVRLIDVVESLIESRLDDKTIWLIQ